MPSDRIRQAEMIAPDKRTMDALAVPDASATNLLTISPDLVCEAFQQTGRNCEIITAFGLNFGHGLLSVWSEWVSGSQRISQAQLDAVHALAQIRTASDLLAAQDVLFRQPMNCLLQVSARITQASAQVAAGMARPLGNVGTESPAKSPDADRLSA